MKKFLSFSVICLVACAVFAQVAPPQAFKYQAVVRNLSGEIVENADIRVRVSILQNWPPGLQVYQEEHSTRSNNLGMIELRIGDGNPLQGHFNQIRWGAGTHHLQLEINVNNTAFTNLGTTELLSVPYALFAGNAGSGGGSFEWHLTNRAIPYAQESDSTLRSSNMLRDAEGNIRIINDATLQIGNYVFPETAGLPGQILVLRDGDSLKWEFGGGTGDGLWERSDVDKERPNIRNINTGNVIVGSTSVGDGFPITNARLHVERGDFVVNSLISSDETQIPFNFTSPAAGIMWWGGNMQAFRVGRMDNDEADNSDLDIMWSGRFMNAWDPGNIGASSIGIGTNVVALSDGTFGLGRNLYIEAPGDPEHPDYPNYPRNSFAIGMDNVVVGENSMIVGGENVIDGADHMSIFGRANTISHTPGLTIFEPSLIVGNNSTIEDAQENVFIFGARSRVTHASNVLALGTENVVSNVPIAEDMTILIGEDNAVNDRLNNILIGTYNRSNADSVIALGSNLHPRTSSIFIGRNNSDQSVHTGGRKNIVIGQDIQIPQITVTGTQNINHNILIGHDIRNSSLSNSFFRANHTIAIGNNIQPHDIEGSSGQGADFSINIGNNIVTSSTNSIRIGNNIDLNDPSHDLNTIAIGNNISFPANSPDADILPDSDHRPIDNRNAIILGTSFPEIYPYYVPSLSGQFRPGAVTSQSRPRFVVGGKTHTITSTTPMDNPQVSLSYDVHYLYMDDNANLYIGTIDRSGGSTSATRPYFLPNHLGGNAGPAQSSSTIYARAMTLGSTHLGLAGTIPIPQPGVLTLLSNTTGTNGNTTGVGRAILSVGAEVANNMTHADGAIPTSLNRTDAGGTIYVTGNTGRSGRIYLGQGAVSTSDRRFKSRIRPLSSGMEEYLYRINAFSYFREGDEEQRLNWGFMAQDVQLYFPHLVHDVNGFGELGLDYIGFIPVLWKINQDQQLLIDRQQARIETLERQVRHINDFNADELRRQANRINALEAQLKVVMEKLEQ